MSALLPAYATRWLARARSRGCKAELYRYKREGGGVCEALWARPAVAPRAVVMVLHATGNDKFYTFLQLYSDLLASGFAVFAFDLDGHGRGSTHQLSEGNVRSMLPQALRELRTLAPELPVHALGQSLGALLILRYLQEKGAAHGLASALLLAPPVSGGVMTRTPWSELRALARPALWLAAPVYGAWGLVPALGSFKRAAYPLRLGSAAVRVAVYGAFVDKLAQEFAAGSQELACPCLFVYGARDGVTPPAQAAAVRAALKPESAWKVIAGETHFTLPLSGACRREVTRWLAQRAR